MPRLNDVQDAQEMRFLAAQLEKMINPTKQDMSREEALEIWERVLEHVFFMPRVVFGCAIRRDLVYQGLVSDEIEHPLLTLAPLQHLLLTEAERLDPEAQRAAREELLKSPAVSHIIEAMTTPKTVEPAVIPAELVRLFNAWTPEQGEGWGGAPATEQGGAA